MISELHIVGRLPCADLSVEGVDKWRAAHESEQLNCAQARLGDREEGAGGERGGTAHRSRRRSRSTAPDEHLGQKSPAKDSMLFDLAQAPAAPQVAVEGTCNGLVRIA